MIPQEIVEDGAEITGQLIPRTLSARKAGMELPSAMRDALRGVCRAATAAMAFRAVRVKEGRMGDDVGSERLSSASSFSSLSQDRPEDRSLPFSFGLR
jgi:hypothetical protein